MGFDIQIMMMMYMCPATGKPYTLKRNKETKTIEKCYELPDLIVPETMQKYLEGRGHHFHVYTANFDEDQRCSVDVYEFLDDYPFWRDVKESPSYDSSWSKEDHRGFKRLLKWCCKQEVTFQITWSY
jgi:hypothetical protein